MADLDFLPYHKTIKAYLFFLFYLSSAAFADSLPCKEITSKQIGEEALTLNGCGTYRKFFFRIYEISLFLKTSNKNPEEILNSPELKYVKMKFWRNLKAKQIQNGIRTVYLLNCEDKCAELNPHLETLLNAVPDMQEDQSFELVFNPKNLVLKIQHMGELVIPSADLGKVLLKTWIGPYPPSQALKSGILGLD